MSSPPTAIRIVIPTSEAPAEVLRLLRQPPRADGTFVPNSVCINGKTDMAEIGRDYVAFVRAETGLIEHDFGYRSFRLDVSSRISTQGKSGGNSWQLGVYLAHCLEDRGALFQSLTTGAQDEKAQHLVWVTGEVSVVTRGVLSVSLIAEKLRASLPLLEAALAAGQKVTLLMPRSNTDDIPFDLALKLRALGVEIHGVTTISEALSVIGFAAKAATNRKQIWRGNPYVGLASFDQAHAEVFFGRDHACRDVLNRLDAAVLDGLAFVLVHGRSGAGKSSLIEAAVVPSLLRRPSDVPRQVVRPHFSGADPLVDLWHEIRKLPGAATAPDAVRDDPAGLLAALGSAAPEPQTVLVLDQFERALISGDAAQIRAFGAVLRALAASGKVLILATLRTNQLELLDISSDLSELARDSRLYRLAPPTRAELIEIIRQPALAAGLRFGSTTDGMDPVERLADEAHGASDALPLLQLTLSHLVETSRGGEITADSLQIVGGISGTLKRLAEKALRELTARGIEETNIDRLLVRLITIDGTSGLPIARILPATSLSSTQDRMILDALIMARLVVEDEYSGQSGVSFAHEALIRQWKHLEELVARLRVDIDLRDRMEPLAQTWVKAGRDQDQLPRAESQISRLEELIHADLVGVSDELARFAQASRAAKDAAAIALKARQEREQRQEKRMLRAQRNFWMAGTAAVVLAGLGGLYFDRLQDQVAQSERYAAGLAAEAAVLADIREARQAETSARHALAQGELDTALASVLAYLGPRDDKGLPISAGFEGLVSVMQEAVMRAHRETRTKLAADSWIGILSGRMLVHDPATGVLQEATDGTGLRPLATVPGRMIAVGEGRVGGILSTFVAAHGTDGMHVGFIKDGRVEWRDVLPVTPDAAVHFTPEGFVVVDTSRGIENNRSRDIWLVDLNQANRTRTYLAQAPVQLRADDTGRSYIDPGSLFEPNTGVVPVLSPWLELAAPDNHGPEGERHLLNRCLQDRLSAPETAGFIEAVLRVPDAVEDPAYGGFLTCSLLPNIGLVRSYRADGDPLQTTFFYREYPDSPWQHLDRPVLSGEEGRGSVFGAFDSPALSRFATNDGLHLLVAARGHTLLMRRGFGSGFPSERGTLEFPGEIVALEVLEDATIALVYQTDTRGAARTLAIIDPQAERGLEGFSQPYVPGVGIPLLHPVIAGNEGQLIETAQGLLEIAPDIGAGPRAALLKDGAGNTLRQLVLPGSGDDPSFRIILDPALNFAALLDETMEGVLLSGIWQTDGTRLTAPDLQGRITDLRFIGNKGDVIVSDFSRRIMRWNRTEAEGYTPSILYSSNRNIEFAEPDRSGDRVLISFLSDGKPSSETDEGPPFALVSTSNDATAPVLPLLYSSAQPPYFAHFSAGEEIIYIYNQGGYMRRFETPEQTLGIAWAMLRSSCDTFAETSPDMTPWVTEQCQAEKGTNP